MNSGASAKHAVYGPVTASRTRCGLPQERQVALLTCTLSKSKRPAGLRRRHTTPEQRRAQQNASVAAAAQSTVVRPALRAAVAGRRKPKSGGVLGAKSFDHEPSRGVPSRARSSRSAHFTGSERTVKPHDVMLCGKKREEGPLVDPSCSRGASPLLASGCAGRRGRNAPPEPARLRTARTESIVAMLSIAKSRSSLAGGRAS